METKKYLLAMAVFAHAALLSLSLTACGDDNDDNEQTIHEEQVDDNAPSGVIAVDLGLPSGTKWANMNVGAVKPEDYGDYYAWGETETKSQYTWATYKWCNGSTSSFTKYCTNSRYGTVDNKTELELSDDVAHTKWGEHWRIPTEVEIKELIDKCSSVWTTQNGVKGRLLSGPNGNSVFFPAAGYRREIDRSQGSYCYYMSSTISPRGDNYAYYLIFNISGSYCDAGYTRNDGISVRPVFK
mgnify:CR=1 FL=1